MERDVMDIIREKEFIELNPSERAELIDLCSTEEEFNQMKSLFEGMSAMNWANPTPKAETKERLDVLFQQNYPKVAPVWYNAPLVMLLPKGKPFYRKPLVQVAAVALLVLIAYPMINASDMNTQNDQLAVLTKDETPTEVKKETTSSEQKEEAEAVSTEINQKTIEAKEVMNDVAIPVRTPIVSSPSRTSTPSLGTIDGVLASKAFLNESALEDFGAAEVVDAFQLGSTHPDGVFMGDRAQLFSVPASHEPAVFDLLTSTF